MQVFGIISENSSVHNENYSVTSEAGINAIQTLQKLREKCGLQPLKVREIINSNQNIV